MVRKKVRIRRKGENKVEKRCKVSKRWESCENQVKIRPHRRCKRACLSGGTNTVSFSWGGGTFLQVKCMVRS